MLPVLCPHLPPMSQAFPQKTALPLELIYDFLFLSRAAWHAGSQCPARDGTCVLCNGSVTPNHWATRKVPFMTYFKSFPSDCIFQPSTFYFSSLGALEWFFCIFFLAALGLCCRAWVSPVVAHGLQSLKARWLPRTGLSSSSTQAELPCGMWDLNSLIRD